jgi:hypothetical protein
MLIGLRSYKNVNFMLNLKMSIMKRGFLLIGLFLLICGTILAQDANISKKDPVGKWKFEAPTAPEGYTTGTMVFGVTEGKYSAGTIFTNFDYKFPGEKVKYANDSVSFVINLEGEAVNVLLKMEDPIKMTGKAVYSEGTVPLTLTRQTENK